jgi:hypothetical protein
MITTLNNKLDFLQYAQTGKFVIYGAGQVGITLLRHLAAKDLIDSVLNFAISDVAKESEEIMGVPVYGVKELSANSRVLIAVHPKLHDEIISTLAEYGITDITGVSWDCYLQIRRTIHDFSTEQLLRQKRLGERFNQINQIEQKTDYIIQRAEYITRIAEEIAQLPEIVATNTAAFSEYENAFEGRDIVLLGTGPSLNKYKSIDGAIHIGVNRAYKFDKVKLDFLFACDFNPYSISEMYGEIGLQDYIDDLKKLECKKFIGNFLEETFVQLPEKYLKEINAVRYFLASKLSERMFCNIKYHPLADWWSIIFSAMHFALFCHPKRIFIVGCDGFNPDSFNHFNAHEEFEGRWLPQEFTKNDFISTHVKNSRIGWEKVKNFAEIHYPDVEIISVNPGYLKGLFKDMEM